MSTTKGLETPRRVTRHPIVVGLSTLLFSFSLLPLAVPLSCLRRNAILNLAHWQYIGSVRWMS